MKLHSMEHLFGQFRSAVSPPKFLLIPSFPAGADWEKASLHIVQTLYGNRQNSSVWCVINAILAINPNHSTVRAAMKKELTLSQSDPIQEP